MAFKFPEDKTFIVAEAGINHNASLSMALQLIDAAVDAGADAIKFQKRTPHMCVPPAEWDVMRDTPWGPMTKIEYRKKIELGPRDYQIIVSHCQSRRIIFSASPWDVNAADTVFELGAPFIKIASASVTNLELVSHIGKMGRPVVMSTGMCTLEQIKAAVKALRGDIKAADRAFGTMPQLGLLVCTSTYPAKPEDLNLERLSTLGYEFPSAVIGYSGHEVGLWTTLCAVALGAKIIERHLTLDRTLPGSDHAASVEPAGFKLLVREIRNFERARGSGEIRVLDCERKDIERLRGPQYAPNGASQEPLQ